MDSSLTRVNFDVLVILDALDRHRSFVTAVGSLYKTPAALNCMIQKLESDLDTVLLDRSNHRAKFIDTSRLIPEKGRQLLSAARDLEEQARQLSADWGQELAITLDAPFPFSALLLLIAESYTQSPQTWLNFSHHTLAGSQEELTHHGADIIPGAINEPPVSAEWLWQTLDALDSTFVVTPAHPLAQAKELLTNKQLNQHWAIVIRDSAHYYHPLNSNLLDEQPQVGVDDFASKVELLCAGLGYDFLPRHIVRPWPERGNLMEKGVTC